MWFSSVGITVLQVFMRPQSQLHKFPPNGGRSSFFWKPPGPDMGIQIQAQEEESDLAARSCPQFAASCLVLEPKPSPETFASIWQVPPEGAASRGCISPDPAQAGKSGPS